MKKSAKAKAPAAKTLPEYDPLQSPPYDATDALVKTLQKELRKLAANEDGIRSLLPRMLAEKKVNVEQRVHTAIAELIMVVMEEYELSEPTIRFLVQHSMDRTFSALKNSNDIKSGFDGVPYR